MSFTPLLLDQTKRLNDNLHNFESLLDTYRLTPKDELREIYNEYMTAFENNERDIEETKQDINESITILAENGNILIKIKEVISELKNIFNTAQIDTLQDLSISVVDKNNLPMNVFQKRVFGLTSNRNKNYGGKNRSTKKIKRKKTKYISKNSNKTSKKRHVK